MSTGKSCHPNRFAPLRDSGESLEDKLKLQGIIFDVDGTLCKPQSYMFQEMRAALNITKSIDILAHIHSLPPSQQSTAQSQIRAIEARAMLKQESQPGLLPLIDYLEEKQIRMALCTRNFDGPVNHLLSTFLPGKVFNPIITRDFHPPKPDPAGLLHIAKEWGLDDGGRRLIMVGDSIDDMVAGQKADAATVLLANAENKNLKDMDCTGTSIERLDHLIGLLEYGEAG